MNNSNMELHKKKFKENIGILVNQNRLDEAKELLVQYENIIIDDVEVYSIKGVIAMMEGKIDEAESVLKKGLLADKKNFDLLYNLGYLYESQEKYITAYRYFKMINKVDNEKAANEVRTKIVELEMREDVNEYIKRKKVLMIAYAFPPMGGPGVQRTLKFVKYLREFGWEPIVLTVGENELTIKDESLIKEVPKEINIIQVNDVKLEEIDSSFINKLISMYSQVLDNSELFNKLVKLLGSGEKNLNKYLFIPEYQSAWALKVINSIDKYLDMQDIDIIYTTADPNADNFIGYFLKKKYNKPWVADFRDAWTKNPYTNYEKNDIKYEIECSMERKLVPYADYLLTVTPLISENFISDLKLNGNVETITNGYDEMDFKNINVEKYKNPKFTIMHNGLFYQIRTPLTFLQAIKNLLEKKLISRKKIKVYFTRKDYWMEVVKEMGLNDVVEFTGYMSHEESLKKSIKCDLLLLIVGEDEGSKSIYTGKVFEYLRLCKPILSLSPKDSLVEKLVEGINRGENIEFNNIKGIEAYILKMYNRWEKDTLNRMDVTEDILKYERKNLTKQLSQVFFSVFDNYEEQETIKRDSNNYIITEKDSKFYDDMFKSGGWDKTYFRHYSETHYYKIWLKALELIKRISNPEIIDIGCGPGQFANLLFDNGIKKYKGIDFSKEAIKYAKIRNENCKNLFAVDNAYTTKIFDGDYNTAVIFEVLEHVDNDLKILGRIREDANILFSVPSFYSDGHVRWFSSEQEIMERYKSYVVFEDIVSFHFGEGNKIFLVKGKVKKISITV